MTSSHQNSLRNGAITQQTWPPASLTGQLDLAAHVRQPSLTLAVKIEADMPVATVSTSCLAQ